MLRFGKNRNSGDKNYSMSPELQSGHVFGKTMGAAGTPIIRLGF